MISNIPIYRAKSNERKNSYVEGFLIGLDEEIGLCTIRTKDDYIGGEICYLHTLAIHLPDMLDSQGNKIFASLREDGKGGDICRIESEMENYVAEFTKEGLKFYEYLDNGKIVNSSYYKVFSIRDIKVIGIQE